jgi:hypothetical protein
VRESEAGQLALQHERLRVRERLREGNEQRQLRAPSPDQTASEESKS